MSTCVQYAYCASKSSLSVYVCVLCHRKFNHFVYVTVWLPSQSQRGQSLKGSSLPQQVDAVQKVDILRALYSQVLFAVQRMKWKSLTSPKSVYAVSPTTLALAPAWHRFTQTHFCRFVSLSCPPTEQLAPQYQLTPHSSQFPKIWHMMCCVLDNTWTPYFQSATFSLPQRYIVSSHLFFISYLHHHRLTSLQTYVIVKSQRMLTTTRTVSVLGHRKLCYASRSSLHVFCVAGSLWSGSYVGSMAFRPTWHWPRLQSSNPCWTGS